MGAGPGSSASASGGSPRTIPTGRRSRRPPTARAPTPSSRARAHQLVHLLRARGLRAGDAVAALLPNGIGLVEWWLACSEAGWYFIPLNTFLTEHEVATIVEHSGARVLVAHERFAAQVATVDRAALAAAFAVGEIAGFESVDEARAAHPATEPDARTPGLAVRVHVGHHRSTQGHPPTADPSAIPGRSPTTPRCSAVRSTSCRSAVRTSCRPRCTTAGATPTTWARSTWGIRW